VNHCAAAPATASGYSAQLIVRPVEFSHVKESWYACLPERLDHQLFCAESRFVYAQPRLPAVVGVFLADGFILVAITGVALWHADRQTLNGIIFGLSSP
jgi:hypothetical protein